MSYAEPCGILRRAFGRFLGRQFLVIRRNFFILRVVARFFSVHSRYGM